VDPTEHIQIIGVVTESSRSPRALGVRLVEDVLPNAGWRLRRNAGTEPGAAWSLVEVTGEPDEARPLTVLGLDSLRPVSPALPQPVRLDC
jgi:hypothetical protein